MQRSALDALRQSGVKAEHDRAFEILAPLLDPETDGDACADLAALELGMSAMLAALRA